MGKYMDEYKRLVSQRNSMQKMYNSTMNQYSYLMSDNAKEWNRVHQNLRDMSYQRDIDIAFEKALKEIEEEAVARVMKQVSIEVQNNSSKPLQDLEKQIKNIFS